MSARPCGNTHKMAGRSRGFAFVEMSSKEEGNAAIQQFNGHDVGGRTLNVNEARLAKSAVAVLAVSAKAAIMAAGAVATNSVAGQFRLLFLL